MHLTLSQTPTNNDDLPSFLCRMQSNSDFIKNFAQKAPPLQKLTRKNTHFKWKSTHQQCFEELLQSFKKIHCLDTLTQKRKYL